MTTTAEVVQEANDLLLGGMKEQITQLNEVLDSTETDITVDAGLEGMGRGDILQCEQELMYILSWTAPTATVMRGYMSVPTTHADNTIVVVNPIVPAVQWLRHINNELRSLSSPVAGLFRVLTTEVTFNSNRYGYDLSDVTDLQEVIDIEGEQTGVNGYWIPFNRNQWTVQRNHSTDDFGSGLALQLRGGAVYPGRPVRTVYKAAFTPLSSFSQNVETVSGIPPTAIDLLAVGAVIRSVESNEISRNKLESQPIRRLGDVPAGALNSASAGLRERYRERRIEERTRLIRKYGL